MILEAVTFDLDETLLRYRRSPGDLLELSFERAGIDPFFSVEEYFAVFDEYVEVGESIEAVRVRCFSHLAREAGRDPAIGRQLAEVYSEERDHGNVELYPGVRDVLDACTGALRMGLVTNGPRETQGEKIAATGIGDRFDIMVFAGDEAPPKPDPVPFERALEGMGVPAGRAIHVGNSLDADVRGATEAGMRAVWVTADGETAPDVPGHRIEAIDQLLDLRPFEAATAR